MASWTAPTTHSTGDVLAVTDWNAVANNETFLYQAPYGAYYNSVTTSVTYPGNTQVTLGGTTTSGYGMSVSSNNVVVPIAGIYSISFAVRFVSGTGADPEFIDAFVEHNGVLTLRGNIIPSAVTSPGSTGAGIISCSASDTIGLWVENGAGTTLSTNNAASDTYIHVFFVGSQ